MRLTVGWLDSRKDRRNRPKERQEETVDGHEGLMAWVYPSGEVVFVFRYTGANGKRRKMRLGQYGDDGIKLAEAFDLHRQAQRELERGLDPIEERERRQKEAERARQHRAAADAVTVRNVIAEWAWWYARRERKRPREAIRLLKVYLKPWMGQPVQDKRRRNAIQLLDAIVARGSLVMANRVRDLAHQAFTFCVARDLISVNPFLGVPDPGGDEESKERFLTRDEIKTVWGALDSPDCGISRRLVCGIKLVLITAQRPGEVLKARFDQFDLPQRTWQVPPEIIKTVKKAKRGKKKQTRAPRVHMVHLTDLAVALIEELRTYAKGRPCLFPAQRSKRNPNGHIEEKAFARALREQIQVDKMTGIAGLFGIEPFTPHDLRRTAATVMTSLGIPRHPDVAKVLNHAEKDDDTTGIYDRWEYWPQKQRALILWEAELRAIIEGRDSPVASPAKSA